MKKKVINTLLVALMALLSINLSAQTIITMERALDIATDNSPNLKRSYLNMERSQENLNAQKASLKSRFSLDVNPLSYSKNRQFDNRLSQWYTNESFNSNGTFRVDQPILWTDGTLSLVNTFGWQNNKSQLSTGSNNNNEAFRNDLYLRLSQPIFTYNTTRMALKEIELDYENSLISYSLQRLSTERQITNQFYAVYTAQERLKVSQNELKNAEENYSIIKNKVDIDFLAKSELFQAELNLANARSAVEDRVVALENAKDDLKQTLGMPIDEDILTTASIDVDAVKIDMRQAIEYALNSRLELRQREIATERLEFQMIRTKASSEFKGSVDMSIGLIGDDKNFGKVYQNPTQNPKVSLSFSIPIFDWGEKKARIRAQEVAQDINQIDISEERRQIELDIRQVYRNLENQLNQIGIAEQSVKNAQLTYDLNTEKYRTGDLTGMEMSQFESQLSSSKMNYVQTLINYKIELLNLKILTLYDFENKVPLVLSTPVMSKRSKK